MTPRWGYGFCMFQVFSPVQKLYASCGISNRINEFRSNCYPLYASLWLKAYMFHLISTLESEYKAHHIDSWYKKTKQGHDLACSIPIIRNPFKAKKRKDTRLSYILRHKYNPHSTWTEKAPSLFHLFLLFLWWPSH